MHQNNVTPILLLFQGISLHIISDLECLKIKVRYIRVLVICQSFPVTCMIRNAVIYKISLYSLCGKKMQLAVGFTTIKNMRRETYKCFIYFRGLNYSKRVSRLQHGKLTLEAGSSAVYTEFSSLHHTLPINAQDGDGPKLLFSPSAQQRIKSWRRKAN